MKSAWLWLVPTLLLGLGAFGGCGGTSDSGSPAGAGTNSGGSASGKGGSSAGSGVNHGGSSTMNGGTMNGGATSMGGSTLEECSDAECGPRLGLPNWTCADGSLGGPTGRCIMRPGGTCGWEINDCPMAGEGGAPSQGGRGNAGEPGAGGSAANDCGGCAAGKICVFQVGGPGPSHFVCATQNPCGSAAACACIVGQGTCQPNLMGDPPRYCSCDNGLE